MNEIDIKKYFLRSLVAALAVSALIGIFIFLMGDFGETEVRLLLTTLTIGGFSLTGLCCATIHHRIPLKSFSIIGMIISAIGFFLSIGVIWEWIEIDNIWKLWIIFLILSIAIAHSSLLLQIIPSSDTIKYSLIATLFFIAFVALMLIKSTLSEFDESEFFFRLLGVFTILDAFGTTATPILNKIAQKKA